MHKTEKERVRGRGGKDGSATHVEWTEMIVKNKRNRSNIAQKVVWRECGHKEINEKLFKIL